LPPIITIKCKYIDSLATYRRKQMTDRNKFEQMLEHLINDESDKAKELFHQLVVEKSREIYENILAEDFNEAKEEDDEEMDEAKEEDEEGLDEAAEEDDEEMEESFGFAEGEDEGGDIGGDAGDDMIDDLEADDEGDEEDMGGEDDIEDRVVDLEDALDELKAEFEALMGDDMGDDDMGDMGDDDMGDMGDDDMGDDMGKMPEDAFMREYVEKVGNPKHGDNGANAKSTVAKSNNMGGTTANIVKGGESTTGGTKGGLANPSSKEDNAGNVNVPGGKAGVKHLKKMATPQGGDNGVNTKSTIGAK